jgi:glycosyltransferase involved in cell wall biosynthesis
MYTADDVTILIATKDRIADLSETLESLCDLNPKPHVVYIVDNSIAQSSKTVVAEFSKRTNIKAFHQPICGKSRSLNLLLDNLNTRVCLFTDDDVRVPSTWVSCMLAQLNKSDSIAVQGEVHIPASYVSGDLTTEERLALFEIRDLGAEFIKSPFLVGANMAIAWHRCSNLRFDENTGPGALGYMDDTLIYLNLIDRGETVAYSNCPVNHYFPRERINKPTPMLDGMKHGRSVAYVEQLRSVPIRKGILLFCFGRLIRMGRYWVAFKIHPSMHVSTLRRHATAFFHYWFRLIYAFAPPRQTGKS